MSTTVADESCTPIAWTCDNGSATAEQIAAAEAGARTLLFGLTGHRVGCFTTTEEAFVPSCASGRGSGHPAPYKDAGGLWRNGVCGSGCCRLPLRRQPVIEISAVRVDGTVLDAAAYNLQLGAVILTTCPSCDGGCDAPIEVDYKWGVKPPAGYDDALGEIACELLSGLTGGACRLSSRAVAIVRQGVTIDMPEAAELVESGLTGLPIADGMIRTLNPNGLRRRSRILSPDDARAVR